MKKLAIIALALGFYGCVPGNAPMEYHVENQWRMLELLSNQENQKLLSANAMLNNVLNSPQLIQMNEQRCRNIVCQ